MCRRAARIPVGLILVVALLAFGVASMPRVAYAEGTTVVYRLYNRWTGDHHFTTSASERDNLMDVGWMMEGHAWLAPRSGSPVYRVYNRYSGEHLYTTSRSEYDRLCRIGWSGEGVAFQSSSSSSGKPVYRLYNRWLTVGTHLYTKDKAEYDQLCRLGWAGEGVAFYASKADLTEAQRRAVYQVKWQGISFYMPPSWMDGKVNWEAYNEVMGFYGAKDHDHYLINMCGISLNRAKGTPTYAKAGDGSSVVIRYYAHGITEATVTSKKSGARYYVSVLDMRQIDNPLRTPTGLEMCHYHEGLLLSGSSYSDDFPVRALESLLQRMSFA